MQPNIWVTIRDYLLWISFSILVFNQYLFQFHDSWYLLQGKVSVSMKLSSMLNVSSSVNISRRDKWIEMLYIKSRRRWGIVNCGIKKRFLRNWQPSYIEEKNLDFVPSFFLHFFSLFRGINCLWEGNRRFLKGKYDIFRYGNKNLSNIIHSEDYR